MRTLVIIALLATVRLAHADDDESAAEVQVAEQDRLPQWEGALAFDAGSFHTSSVTNLAVGLDVEAGLRMNRLALLGEYRFLGLSSFDGPTPPTAGVAAMASTTPAASVPTGYVHRFGLALRYSLFEVFTPCHTDWPCGFRTDLWLEGGVGEQLIQWDAGGQLHRPDVSLGLGWSIGGRDDSRHEAYFIAVRATLSRPPAGVSNTPTCAGPCDTPTPPVNVDRSILFTTGFVFGS